MKTIKKFVLAGIVLLFLCPGSFAWSADLADDEALSVSPQQTIKKIPLEITVPENPIPFKAEGGYHLVYELFITNMSRSFMTLAGIEVLSDGHTLADFTSDQLDSMVIPMIDLPEGGDIRDIPRGSRTVAFLWVTLDREEDIPDTLSHRIAVFMAGEHKSDVLDAPEVSVDRAEPVQIASPVFGEGWLAAEGPLNINGFSHHRFGIITMEGKARVPQRYAIDWLKFGPDGMLFKDDPSINENWYCYGEPIHAVSDGVVVQTLDGIPDNVPLLRERAVPITLDTVAGNFVVVDSGEGAHVLYAHLIPGSVRVREGDRVTTGQVLGLLGNSGNSDAPHLHFHINRAPAVFPLAAEGLPFVQDSLILTGKIPVPFEIDIEELSWDGAESVQPVELEYEMPLGYRVYTINR